MTTIVHGSSSTAHVSSSYAPTTEESYVTEKEPQDLCIVDPEELKVLCESLVDFQNPVDNDFDLRDELIAQRWENFFERLHGPVYEALVRDLFKHAECDDLYITSHVLGSMIAITKKSISDLLGMTFLDEECVYGKDNKSKFVRSDIHKAIFKNLSPQKKDFKNVELQNKLRIWHKIILNYINPRASFVDNFNVNQKYMLYYLQSHHKMNLQSIMFQYLKDTIKSTIICVIQSKKTKNYIPFGRLLSDIFIENGLVEFLSTEGKYAEDLVPLFGELFNIKTLKHMTMVTHYQIDPQLPPSDLAQRRTHVANYPSFCKKDNPEEIVPYMDLIEKA
ncbi:uncharacterized protein LOC131605081 [Vicia villosa]|uniref:uncharacterized protein LOC131605081 n=1 Tax=Vicia villosa TaxID=3911 RepID=UPI00273C04FE|nr:uncharacterized protein LOC131605081 [Vicia villosa]